jgi:hypothetical protein
MHNDRFGWIFLGLLVVGSIGVFNLWREGSISRKMLAAFLVLSGVGIALVIETWAQS